MLDRQVSAKELRERHEGLAVCSAVNQVSAKELRELPLTIYLTWNRASIRQGIESILLI